MTYYTYDTSVIVSRNPLILPGQSERFLLSAVVLMELCASARDESQRRMYERLFRAYAQDNSLITPDDHDWLLASKVLFWLAQGRRRSRKGRATRLKPGASQRMALDALIAVSARRWKAAVVTENWEDFRAIQRYCNVSVVKAAHFFRHSRP